VAGGATITAAGGTLVVGLALDRIGGKLLDSLAEFAESAASALRLEKQLASSAQMAEEGKIIAGAGSRTALRDAERLVASYGGKASDWAKVSSSSYVARDGVRIETRWYQNVTTGQIQEYKTVIK
jgi:hypothetical protein